MKRARFGAAVLLVTGLLAQGCETVDIAVVEIALVSLDPSSLELSVAQSETLTPHLTDASGRPLPGRVVTWISRDPAVATVDSDGVVRGEAVGSTTIEASSEGVTGTAAVTVTPHPRITLSRTELAFTSEFGGDPTQPMVVEITSDDASVLSGIEVEVSYPPEEERDWLEATLSSASTPTALVVRAIPSSLESDVHRSQILVSAPGALNSPQAVEVTLEIGEAPPTIRVNPAGVSFAADAGQTDLPSQTLDITNGGAGVLSGLGTAIRYEAGAQSGWLSGVLDSTTAPARLTLTVDPDGLSPGVYDAVVDVSAQSASGDPVEVEVRFRYGEAPPEIELGASEVEWEIEEDGSTIPTRTVSIGNRGTGELGDLDAQIIYDEDGPTGWLAAAPGSATAPTELHLAIVEPDLDRGEYSAEVIVTSPDAINSPQSLELLLRVRPRLSLSQSTITALPTSIVADGEASATVTVELVDSRGGPFIASDVTVALTTTAGSLGAVTNNGDGSYETTLTSANTAGTAIVTATVDGDPLTTNVQVEFVPGPPAAITLTGPETMSILAPSAPFTLTLIDASGNPAVADQNEVFNLSTSGSGSFTPSSPIQVATGESSATFRYSDLILGSRTITATWATGTGTDLGSDTHQIQVQLLNDAEDDAASGPRR